MSDEFVPVEYRAPVEAGAQVFNREACRNAGYHQAGADCPGWSSPTPPVVEPERDDLKATIAPFLRAANEGCVGFPDAIHLLTTHTDPEEYARIYNIGYEDAVRHAACTGAGDCPAKVHTHGCYADVGNCDDPDDHAAPPPVVESPDEAPHDPPLARLLSEFWNSDDGDYPPALYAVHEYFAAQVAEREHRAAERVVAQSLAPVRLLVRGWTAANKNGPVWSLVLRELDAALRAGELRAALAAAQPEGESL